MKNSNYVNVIYNPDSKPFTDYPGKLINYLIKKYKLSKNSSLLELGCGRGEFLKAFADQGMRCYGVDNSDYAKHFYKNLNIVMCDLLKQKLPFDDNHFDIIYSKSVVEHFYYPEIILEEAHRVLKPGGIIITLTPEWTYIYKSFYEDYTHRTPFSKISLKDIHLTVGFKNVEVESFKQLPILWNSSGNNFLLFSGERLFKMILSFFSFLTRIIFPDYFRLKYKWVRFSKEVMLLSAARK